MRRDTRFHYPLLIGSLEGACGDDESQEWVVALAHGERKENEEGKMMKRAGSSCFISCSWGKLDRWAVGVMLKEVLRNTRGPAAK